MRLFAAALCVTTAFGLGVNAEARTPETLDLVARLGESQFEIGKFLLRRAGDFVSRNPDAPMIDGHEEFRRILEGGRNFTALVAIDSDGTWMFDSFNKEPIIGRAGSLGDREYFLGARIGEPNIPEVYEPIIGRQSGNFLIPVAMPVSQADQGPSPVVVTFMLPSGLVPNIDLCNFCGIIVLKDRKIIASDRPVSDINKDVVARMHFEGDYGAQVMEVRQISLDIDWVRGESSGMIYLLYEGKPLADRF